MHVFTVGCMDAVADRHEGCGQDITPEDVSDVILGVLQAVEICEGPESSSSVRDTHNSGVFMLNNVGLWRSGLRRGARPHNRGHANRSTHDHIEHVYGGAH